MALSAPTDGEAFGRYRLIERIGAGGMAVVYRAMATTSEGQSVVVVKRVLPTLSSDPAFIKMLVAEARLSSRLSHPGIVRMHELGRVHDEYFLTMEYVDGLDLLRLLNRCVVSRTPMPIGVACYVAQKVAAALSYAHSLKDAEGRALEIVHRDVSPANIMVTFDGQVMLLDFGVAKAAEHVHDDRTRTGTLKGKINYLSPEQAEGLTVDGRSDLFALGIVLHECLTLKRLFRGSSDLVTLRLVRQCEVAPPSHLRPEVATELDTIVLRMLARDREQRFTKGDDVAAALEPLVERYGGSPAQVAEFLARMRPVIAPVLAEEPKGEPESDTIALRLHSVAAGETEAVAIEASPASTGEEAAISIVVAEDDPPAAPAPRPPKRRGLTLVGASALLLLTGAAVVASTHTKAKQDLPVAIIPAPAEPIVAPTPTPSPAPASTTPARLSIELDVAKAQIWFDGALVGDGVRRARVAVDRPGEHLIKVSAPRRQPYHRTITVAAGMELDIRIALKRATSPNSFEKAKVHTNDGDYLVDPFGPKH